MTSLQTLADALIIFNEQIKLKNEKRRKKMSKTKWNKTIFAVLFKSKLSTKAESEILQTAKKHKNISPTRTTIIHNNLSVKWKTEVVTVIYVSTTERYSRFVLVFVLRILFYSLFAFGSGFSSLLWSFLFMEESDERKNKKKNKNLVNISVSWIWMRDSYENRMDDGLLQCFSLCLMHFALKCSALLPIENGDDDHICVAHVRLDISQLNAMPKRQKIYFQLKIISTFKTTK